MLFCPICDFFAERSVYCRPLALLQESLSQKMHASLHSEKHAIITQNLNNNTDQPTATVVGDSPYSLLQFVLHIFRHFLQLTFHVFPHQIMQ